jgi:hypothetical protein
MQNELSRGDGHDQFVIEKVTVTREDSFPNIAFCLLEEPIVTFYILFVITYRPRSTFVETVVSLDATKQIDTPTRIAEADWDL